MLSEEQIAQIKAQITQQIESTFPEDKKELAKNQIQSMTSKQLEEFLNKNKLITEQDSSTQQCVFCSIVSGDTSSYKIDENNFGVAVLELNPISKGHTLVIPKKHVSSKEDIPKEVLSLVKEVSKKIKSKLKPKDIKISSTNLFGHEIINVLPIYEDETFDSKRKSAKPEELEDIQKSLAKPPPKEIIKKPQIKKIKGKIWMPKRIP